MVRVRQLGFVADVTQDPEHVGGDKCASEGSDEIDPVCAGPRRVPCQRIHDRGTKAAPGVDAAASERDQHDVRDEYSVADRKRS